MMTTGADSNKKQVNHARLQWHEFVLQDPEVRKRPHALALAGHLMHRFNWENGYAEVSSASAAKVLNAKQRSIERAFAFLIFRGWVQLREPYSPRYQRWSANRYSLSFGPDDLDPSQHRVRTSDDTGDATRAPGG